MRDLPVHVRDECLPFFLLQSSLRARALCLLLKVMQGTVESLSSLVLLGGRYRLQFTLDGPHFPELQPDRYPRQSDCITASGLWYSEGPSTGIGWPAQARRDVTDLLLQGLAQPVPTLPDVQRQWDALPVDATVTVDDPRVLQAAVAGGRHVHLPANPTLLAQAVVRTLPSCTLHLCGQPLDPMPWPTMSLQLAPIPVFVAQGTTLPYAIADVWHRVHARLPVVLLADCPSALGAFHACAGAEPHLCGSVAVLRSPTPVGPSFLHLIPRDAHNTLIDAIPVH